MFALGKAAPKLYKNSCGNGLIYPAAAVFVSFYADRICLHGGQGVLNYRAPKEDNRFYMFYLLLFC